MSLILFLFLSVWILVLRVNQLIDQTEQKGFNKYFEPRFKVDR